MKQVIQFVLVPDASAARRLRRIIAENASQSDVVVGTWQELIAQAETAYLIAKSKIDWDEAFKNALKSLPNAFWSESLKVAEAETMTSVQNALSLVVAATNPNEAISFADSDQLKARPRKHLSDLNLLLQSLNGILPSDLAAINKILAIDTNESIRSIQVYYPDNVLLLSTWQKALIEKLNSDTASSGNNSIKDELTTILKTVFEPQLASTTNSLSTIQKNLFLKQTQEQKPQLDESVQWIGVRDYQQEAEIAAGMVQSMLSADTTLKPADIALMLPNSFEYLIAVEDAFTKAGLATSGLPIDRWQTDLGREAVFHFLHCRKRPAPAMALAVCLSSPLMPWSREEGGVLAQKVMDGSYALKPLTDAGKDAKRMLQLLADGDEKPASLIKALKNFVSLLNGGDEFSSHVYQAKTTVDCLCAYLENQSDVDWLFLRSLATPKNISTGETANFNREGVTIWREGHEPWRTARNLIVFGFASGNYPTPSGVSPVFVVDDLLSIKQHLNLAVIEPNTEFQQRRERFKRQLSAVSDSATFLIPRRSSDGKSQSPSESLVFMQQLFDCEEGSTADELILDLDVLDNREQIRHLAITNNIQVTPPRIVTAKDMSFDRDLLSLRKDDDGNNKPESPSGLETLMISPLAWLLSRIKAEPLSWAPERPNVMLLGTLAHQVFEDLFQGGKPVPSEDEINNKIVDLMDDAIRQNGPFLRAAQWQVEKQHLISSTLKAAQAWRSVLEALDVEILGNEEWLQGQLNGIGIHGQVDVILGLSDNRLLVVDYKRSSANSRRPRMQKSYDSQASLYRTMLETGGPKDKDNTALINKLKNASSKGIVYYMLNDQASLSDSLLMESGGIPGWEVIDGDVASSAIKLIQDALSEITQGRIKLNRIADENFFETKAKVKPYALQGSPLVNLFTLANDGLEAGTNKSEVTK